MWCYKKGAGLPFITIFVFKLNYFTHFITHIFLLKILGTMSQSDNSGIFWWSKWNQMFYVNIWYVRLNLMFLCKWRISCNWHFVGVSCYLLSCCQLLWNNLSMHDFQWFFTLLTLNTKCFMPESHAITQLVVLSLKYFFKSTPDCIKAKKVVCVSYTKFF